MARKAMRFESILSKREAECLSWISSGKTSFEVSQILGISERTVNFHVNNCMKKFNAVNRTHLVGLFVKSHLMRAIAESKLHHKCTTCPLHFGDRVLDGDITELICGFICGKKKPTQTHLVQAQ